MISYRRGEEDACRLRGAGQEMLCRFKRRMAQFVHMEAEEADASDGSYASSMYSSETDSVYSLTADQEDLSETQMAEDGDLPASRPRRGYCWQGNKDLWMLTADMVAGTAREEPCWQEILATLEGIHSRDRTSLDFHRWLMVEADIYELALFIGMFQRSLAHRVASGAGPSRE